MKICMLSIDFLPNVGGIASHIYELAKKLIEQDNEVFIITFRDKLYNKKYEEIAGIKIFRVYYPKIKYFGWIIYLIQALIKLKLLDYKRKIDIIHSHTLLPDSFLFFFFRKKCKIQTEHTSGFLELVEKNKYVKILSFLLNQADFIIGPSEELVNNFIKIGIDKSKTAFIPNGVDIKKFNPKIDGNKIRKKYSIRKNEKLILCPRRLEPKNGVIYLVKALPYIIEKIRNIKCMVVGGGFEDEKKRIIKEIKKKNIAEKIVLVGTIPNHKMPEYYATSDIVVLPSLKEATSIAGLEAMAMCKPVVGTNAGGLPYIIENEKTGLIVPPKNPKVLAKAIISILNNEEKQISMGATARKRVEEKFSWEIIAKKILEIYKQVFENRNISKEK